MNKLTGYLGTYASPESLGIYRFSLDLKDGSLSRPELYYNAPDCKYLSLDGTMLAAPENKGGLAGVCLLDISAKEPVLIGEAFHETAPACYVTQDCGHLYTANYHEGSVLVYDRSPEGIKLAKRIHIAPKAGCHQILLYDHYMLVPCLLLDSVKIYDCDRDYSLVGELTFPKGTGPRHGIFDPFHHRLFLVSELSNQVFLYQAGETAPREVYSILPQGAVYHEPPASAAVRLSPDGRFLYVSTRFADLITVYSIDGSGLHQIQQAGCGGVHPRDIILTPDGRYLLSVNRTRGGLVCFGLDPESGRILGLCSRVPAPEAVSVVLA
ncbi:beta-propeller fold lactonase family protein [Enterocloster citroniae]|uniref:lactonase family protein n=1 Tax=Enterocloster citroniae TaxID=358743 RepID=UPI0032BF556A